MYKLVLKVIIKFCFLFVGFFFLYGFFFYLLIDLLKLEEKKHYFIIVLLTFLLLFIMVKILNIYIYQNKLLYKMAIVILLINFFFNIITRILD